MVRYQDFYRSREWEDLIKIIRLERLNKDGFNICEHCGKPIIHKYDCIGHHKIPLTSENYSDAQISLNSSNIALVHHACHNRIHNKLVMGERQVFIVYGSPLSGKSSWVRENKCEGDLIVDIDRLWECVSGCQPYTKPPRLNGIVFPLYNQLLDLVRYRQGKWLNAYVIGGYPLISERERLSRELGARLVYIDTDKSTCLERLNINPNGRNIEEWTGFIERWFSLYTPPPKRI